MNTSNLDWDALIRAAARDLLKEEDNYIKSIDTSNVEISKKAYRRIKRTIKNYERESWWSNTPFVFRRIVAALMIACTVSFSLCLSVSAVRAEMVNIVMKWYDKFVSVIYVSENVAPSVIEDYREPLLQLAGTERQVVLKSNSQYHILYTMGDDFAVFYQQMLLSEKPIDIDNERCIIEEIEVQGNKGQLFVYEDGRYAITWSDNEYKYLILTDTPEMNRELLLLTAEFIK